MDEMVKHSAEMTKPSSVNEDIEGEFTAEKQSIVGQPSGYFCRRCDYKLLVGDKVCKGCGWQFSYATAPSEGLSPSWVTLMTKERKLLIEIETYAKFHKKKR